jgi:phosphatidylinositol-4-phosphate 3-kinase
VRGKAVCWLGGLASDELSEYLPQLVQALKYESYHTSPLAHMLLQRAIHSNRLAHQLYWYVHTPLHGSITNETVC